MSLRVINIKMINYRKCCSNFESSVVNLQHKVCETTTLTT